MERYSSSTLQCKLHYGNSLQCDTYQLGEMVKFFHKLGLVSLTSTMAGLDGKDPYDGNIFKAVRLLMGCPSYQIDKDHGHCGVKDRMVPWLTMIEQLIPFTGICLECWTEDRKTNAWKNAKGPLSLQARSFFAVSAIKKFFHRPQKSSSAGEDHWNCGTLRDFFLADAIDWT
jgi:hypothetical protein